MVSTFLGYQVYARDMQKSLQHVAAQPTVKRDAAYFDQNIGKVKSVDDFLKNYRLFSYAMKAFGLQDMTNARALMKKVMESDLTDPKSFANKLTDTRYRDFAAAFNFNTKGTVTSTADVQSDDQQSDMLGLYTLQHASSSTDAATATKYYDDHIGSVTSVDQLLGDSKLYNYVLSAYGISADSSTQSQSEVKDSVRQALESNIADASSFANKQANAGFKAMAASFNFDTSGAVKIGKPSQTTDQETATTSLYAQNRNDGAAAADVAATAYYEANIGKVKSVDDVLNDGKLYSYALRAVGLDPGTESKQSIKWALESDLSNPASFAGSSKNPAYATLAAAFGFNSTGGIKSGSTTAQTAAQTQSIVDAFTNTAARSAVDPMTAYYQANIGSITSVDQFLNNSKLYNYVLSTYGITPQSATQTPSDIKDSVRKALESDLSDPTSFANSQANTGFKAMAAAFNFDATGALKSGKASQTADQTGATTSLYIQNRNDTAAATGPAATSYFLANIGNVKSVDDLLNDDNLYAYALRSAGLDPAVESKQSIKAALESDLGNPASFAKTAGNPAYATLAAAFNFNATGGLSSGSTTAQTSAQTQSMVSAFVTTTAKTAADATNYYQANIGSIASVNDLVGNSQLYAYALTAYGLDPDTENPGKIIRVLESDLSDPTSYANTQTNANYRDLAAAFNFGTDGNVIAGKSVQSSKQLAQTTDVYATTYNDKAATLDSADTAYFTTNIGTVKSLSDLLSNGRLYNTLLSSVGIDPTTVSQDTIANVLTSDLSDPKSFANQAADHRYRDLASLVNFTSQGTIAAPPVAQSAADIRLIERDYTRAAGSSASAQAAAKTETTYYSTTIATIDSVDDLLNDKRMVSYSLQAAGFGTQSVSTDTLRKILTSDLSDPKSFANKSTDPRYRSLAAYFHFSTTGSIARTSTQQPQTNYQRLMTDSNYLQQTMQVQAGDQNQGVRLALYFQQKASTITSAYSILADKALLQVVQTALGLPSATSKANIDVQARNITQRINLADFQNPKKLQKFLNRFATLYDLNGGSQTAATPTTALGV